MARLILEEDGETRRFRLNEGKLTIGSGEAATLTCRSADVAEVHAEIELIGDIAVLRVRKGVTPVTVQGRRITGEVELRHGRAVRIGSATLTVEYEGQAAATPAVVTRGGGGARPTGAGSRRASARGGEAEDERPRRRSRSTGVPTWLMLLMAGVAVAGLYYAMGGYAKEAGARAFSEQSVRHNVEEALDNRDFLKAQEELRRVDAVLAGGHTITPEWRKIFMELRARTDELTAAAEVGGHNIKGTKYLDSQLKNFVKRYMSQARRPQARVLLQRIAWFRGEYPEHPQLDWCERMEQRFRDVAALGEPDTYEDMAFEVKTLTWSMPRNYVEAFDVIDLFLPGASPEDRDRALTLIDEKEGEREEYFKDRIEQAKYLWVRDSQGQAIEWLVQLVIKIDDETMADDAATRLVKMDQAVRADPNMMNDTVVSLMRGYRNDRRADFDALAANRVMRQFFDEHGVE